MRTVLGLGLIGISLLYGYSLAVQPSYATAQTARLAEWAGRQHKLLQSALAFVVWLMFMTGLRMFATRGG
jgi:hypothetical protein